MKDWFCQTWLKQSFEALIVSKISGSILYSVSMKSAWYSVEHVRLGHARPSFKSHSAMKFMENPRHSLGVFCSRWGHVHHAELHREGAEQKCDCN